MASASRKSSAAARRPAQSRQAEQRQVEQRRAEERRSRFAVIDRSGRRRRVSPAALVGLTLAAAIAFGALATQIELIHRQMRLDGIHAEITALQANNKKLRQQATRLQSPAEIRRIAEEELHMVPSRKAVPVSPPQQIIGILEFPPVTTAAPGA